MKALAVNGLALAGGVSLVIAAFTASTIAGFAVLGIVLCLAAYLLEITRRAELLEEVADLAKRSKRS